MTQSKNYRLLRLYICMSLSKFQVQLVLLSLALECIHISMYRLYVFSGPPSGGLLHTCIVST